MKHVIFIGIDPGLNGAIAVITDAFSINIFKMPTITHGNGRKAPDHVALKEFFRGFQSLRVYTVLELQHAMPKQGVVSTLNLGYGFGALKQCLVDFLIPHEVVQASTWQKEFGIFRRKGDTKVQSIRICQDLFPDVSLLPTERSKKPHDGFADALLIAEYARRRHSGADT